MPNDARGVPVEERRTGSAGGTTTGTHGMVERRDRSRAPLSCNRISSRHCRPRGWPFCLRDGRGEAHGGVVFTLGSASTPCG